MQIDEDGNNPLAENKLRPKFMYEISGAHNATVNIVRFSPNGMYLASGGDDSAIVIWTQKMRPVQFGSCEERVQWSNQKILRGHLSDIYDLCWSPDSKYMVSGSIDNLAKIWNLEKGKYSQTMSEHSHFVQGVAWDPRNKYIVTQSSDKSARVYKNADTKQKINFFFYQLIKRKADKEEYTKKEKTISYFADEMQCPS
jgi:chromatin assembly factor 1 subunit B